LFPKCFDGGLCDLIGIVQSIKASTWFDLYFGGAFDGVCYLLSVCVEME
jgi:hypothetical protein